MSIKPVSKETSDERELRILRQEKLKSELRSAMGFLNVGNMKELKTKLLNSLEIIKKLDLEGKE